jgi:cell wall-associated NlpC family hydrolase
VKPDDLLRADYLRGVVVEYAKHFIGIPYAWGGDDPMAGFDCSGFVVEVLHAVGKLQARDYSAHDLYTLFKPNIVVLGYAGCLAFWLDDAGHAVHVMVLVDNAHVIGASGGGSKTTSLPEAIRDNAFIKMRPLSYRKGTPVIVDPFRKILE